MFNSAQTGQSSDTGKQSALEWMRSATYDFFHLLSKTAGSGVGCYADLATAPEMASPAEAAEFSGQIRRMHAALEPARKPEAESRGVKVEVRRASQMMAPADMDFTGAVDPGASL